MKDFHTLTLETIDDVILKVTLNRPEVRNAINTQMMTELYDFWQKLLFEPQAIRCIILTGADPAFCAGADLKERFKMDMGAWQAQRQILERAMLSMIECPIPIIAAVNGAAFGGGLELALACDFIYAAENATFALSEVKLGLIPGAMGTQHLPKACGLRRAKELMYTGKTFNAGEALNWGMVNTLLPAADLHTAVLQTAQLIIENAPLAVRQVKAAANMSQHLDIQSGYFFEIAAYNRILQSEDRVEGIKAFNEKRKPKFKGQ